MADSKTHVIGGGEDIDKEMKRIAAESGVQHYMLTVDSQIDKDGLPYWRITVPDVPVFDPTPTDPNSTIQLTPATNIDIDEPGISIEDDENVPENIHLEESKGAGK